MIVTMTSAEHTPTPILAFREGAIATLPLLAGAIPFGIVFGTLGPASGLSTEATLLMSVIVFAGSSQFIALGLISLATPIWLIVLTTAMVNLRHLLYSVSLIPRVRDLPQYWRVPLGFGLTDETFAVLNSQEAARFEPQLRWYFLGSALAMYCNWQACTLLGVTLGSLIPDMTRWGLDIAMSVTFIGIVVPQLINLPRTLAAVTAGLLALLLRDMPHQLGLIISALAGIGAGTIAGRLNGDEALRSTTGKP